MSAGPWGNYENDETLQPPYDRGQITSELELDDSELREMEQILGHRPDEAFDRYRDGERSPRIGNGTRGTTGTENGEVVLESFRDITADTLAHESVHGFLRQPDAELDLPGEDYFDHEVYEETVAILAESEILPEENSVEDLQKLKEERENYLSIRESEPVLPENFSSLYEDTEVMDDVLDEKVGHIKDQRDLYQSMRSTVLARESANEYRSENSVEIEKLVKPDEQQYNEVMNYVEKIEQNLEKRI